jgi:hypothetical protein
MIGKKELDNTTRLSYEDREKMYMDGKMKAMEKALQDEKVRYKSDRDPVKFKEFLEHRLTIWDELKDKTFHGKRMYEKTKTLIENWN